MNTSDVIVGVYDPCEKALKALVNLRHKGLPVKNISHISKGDVIEKKINAASNYRIPEIPVEIAVIIGILFGLLSGIRIISIPGLSFIFGTGAILGALAGFDFGIIGGGIISFLMSLRILKNKSSATRENFEHDKYIIMINGKKDIAEKAKSVLHTLT